MGDYGIDFTASYENATFSGATMTGGAASGGGSVAPSKVNTGGSGASVNWSAVGASMMLAGGLYSAINQYQASKANAASLRRQAQDVLNEANQQSAFEQLNNQMTQEAYMSDRLELMRAQKAQMGALHAGVAASGVEMSGSAREMLAKQGEANARDLFTLDRNAQKEAFLTQYRCEQMMISAEYKAASLRISAKYADKAAKGNLFAGILSTVGSAAAAYGA